LNKLKINLKKKSSRRGAEIKTGGVNIKSVTKPKPRSEVKQKTINSKYKQSSVAAK
jgi:hypothetical protein